MRKWVLSCSVLENMLCEDTLLFCAKSFRMKQKPYLPSQLLFAEWTASFSLYSLIPVSHISFLQTVLCKWGREHLQETPALIYFSQIIEHFFLSLSCRPPFWLRLSPMCLVWQAVPSTRLLQSQQAVPHHKHDSTTGLFPGSARQSITAVWILEIMHFSLLILSDQGCWLPGYRWIISLTPPWSLCWEPSLEIVWGGQN